MRPKYEATKKKPQDRRFADCWSLKYMMDRTVRSTLRNIPAGLSDHRPVDTVLLNFISEPSCLRHLIKVRAMRRSVD